MGKKTIILTGGGTAGHVTPNIALLAPLNAQGFDVHYIGTKNGIEKTLITPLNVKYHTIRTGKLRRYFSWQNFIDPFNLLFGMIKSIGLCLRLRPRVIFSKGGFVSLPVCLAGWLTRTPVILHESDLTPGLANRLSFRFAKTICISFEDTQTYIKKYAQKVIYTGSPIRPNLLTGDADKGLQFAGIKHDKPIILVICGSMGSEKINTSVRASLKELLPHYSILHICGPGKTDDQFDQPGYKQFAYINEELPDIFACCDMVISRAGANSVFELLNLRKPSVLIPLSLAASRGDQIHNARFAERAGYAQILAEEKLNPSSLVDAIKLLDHTQATMRESLKNFKQPDTLNVILDLINA